MKSYFVFILVLKVFLVESRLPRTGCELDINHPSVTYTCRTLKDPKPVPCKNVEPVGTILSSTCKPGFYFPKPRDEPICAKDFYWSGLESLLCSADCGLLKDGNRPPWYAIFFYHHDDENPGANFDARNLKPFCSGTIISTRYILTSMRCFTRDMGDYQFSELKIKDYKVAVGKHSEEYGKVDNGELLSIHDLRHQRTFLADSSGILNDIAIAEVSAYDPIKYTQYVSPICMDFTDPPMEAQNGKMAGVFGAGSVQMKSVSRIADEDCGDAAVYRDKICVKSDAFKFEHSHIGSGYTYQKKDTYGVERYFLRGFLSYFKGNKSDVAQFTDITMEDGRQYLLRDELWNFYP